jgi:EmrB/QacA subfamily drug resistance transporter
MILSMNMRNEKNVVLFIAVLGSFFSSFMMSGLNIAVPEIGREFSMSAVWLNWISLAFVMTSTVLMIPFSKLADWYGYKRTYLTGTIIYVVISLILPLSHSSLMFIITRAVQGIGGAMTVVTSLAMITYVFPAQERGKAIGFSAAAVYLGLSIGPFLGGLLTQYLGWRSIFFVYVPFGLVVIILIIWKLKSEWSFKTQEKFDLTGSVLYTIVLIALIFGLSFLPKLIGFITVGLSIIVLIIFIRWETKTNNPVMQINLFRKSRIFAFSNLANLLNYTATMSVAFLLSLFLQYNKGLSPSKAGLIILVSPVVQTIFSPITGRLSDRIEPLILASCGIGINCVGMASLAFANEMTPVWAILASLIALGFGSALFVSPNTNAIMGSVSKELYSAASATLATMRTIGGVLSQAIIMLMFALLIGNVEISPPYYAAFLTSMKIVFIIAAVSCFIGIFLSLARGKR